MASKTCGKRNVYRLAPNDNPGILNREWHDTAPAIPINSSTTAAGRDFRLGHDFSLPTTTTTTVTSLNLNDTDNTAQELDIQTLDTVINVPAGGIWIQYQGGSEGYWAIEVGECCNPLVLKDELGYVDRDDNNAIVGPVFLPEGQHYFRAWNIDSGGTNSSHSVRYSTDGNAFAAAVPDGVEFSQGKRATECQAIENCDPVPDGWDDCPPADCSQTFPMDGTDCGCAGGGGEELTADAILALVDARVKELLNPKSPGKVAAPAAVKRNKEKNNL